MSKYPTESTLKSSLTVICSANPEYCQAVATKFGSADVACNNRVPQATCFTLGAKYGVSDEDCAKVAEYMCEFKCTK